jgi:hypothetical protein
MLHELRGQSIRKLALSRHQHPSSPRNTLCATKRSPDESDHWIGAWQPQSPPPARRPSESQLKRGLKLPLAATLRTQAGFLRSGYARASAESTKLISTSPWSFALADVVLAGWLLRVFTLATLPWAMFHAARPPCCCVYRACQIGGCIMCVQWCRVRHRRAQSHARRAHAAARAMAPEMALESPAVAAAVARTTRSNPSSPSQSTHGTQTWICLRAGLAGVICGGGGGVA